MVTAKDVSKYIDKTYVSKEPKKYYKPICDLANMPKITINRNAYNFDEIKNDINPNARSCDVLYIGKWLNFIEFKQGFSKAIESEKYELKKENMALSISLKACHSLQIFNNEILPYIEDGVLALQAHKVFCAVLDSQDPECSEGVYTDINLEEAHMDSKCSLKKNILDGVIRNLRVETKNKKRAFYDDAHVFYDYEFDANFAKTMK